jgi:hypothetical protein
VDKRNEVDKVIADLLFGKSYEDFSVNKLILGALLFYFPSRICNDECVGMDLEWKPMFKKGEYSYTALLQLCNGEMTAIFRLWRLRIPHTHVVGPYGRYRLPESLERLLSHPNVLKAHLFDDFFV